MTDDPITPERIDGAIESTAHAEKYGYSIGVNSYETIAAALAFTKKYKPVVDGMEALYLDELKEASDE